MFALPQTSDSSSRSLQIPSSLHDPNDPKLSFPNLFFFPRKLNLLCSKKNIKTVSGVHSNTHHNYVKELYNSKEENKQKRGEILNLY